MKSELARSLCWAGGILLLALGTSAAHKLGHMDGETVTRLVIGANGLMIAWYGNRLPKTFVPYRWARQARRVAGWSLALSGLAYAGLFAFAPIPMAAAGACAAVLTGMAVTLGYCMSLRSKANTA